MKKLCLIFAIASVAALANAQDMTSKRGTPILPEAGDLSIGFDVVPVLSSIGNVFHSGGGSGPYSQQNLTLVALMVKDETTAHRARLRLGFGSTTTNPNPGSTSQDSLDNASEMTTSGGFNLTLGAGLQKSRGKGRLHGIYGVEAQIMFGSGSDATNKYAKPIDATNQPSTGSRVTESKGGSSFGIGVDAFIGAEYFFAPKFSLSAEYNWGIIFSSSGDTEATTESWDATNSVVKTTVLKGGKSSSFSADVANATQIILHCYF